MLLCGRGALLPKPTPPADDGAEKPPAETVLPEWIGVIPPLEEVLTLRLLEEVCTRSEVSPPREDWCCCCCWLCCCCWGCWKLPAGLGAPIPASAWAACIREEEAGRASGELVLEFERWWRPWRGISGEGYEEGGTPRGRCVVWGGGRGEAESDWRDY